MFNVLYFICLKSSVAYTFLCVLEFDANDFNLSRNKFGFKLDATVDIHCNFTNIC